MFLLLRLIAAIISFCPHWAFFQRSTETFQKRRRMKKKNAIYPRRLGDKKKSRRCAWKYANSTRNNRKKEEEEEARETKQGMEAAENKKRKGQKQTDALSLLLCFFWSDFWRSVFSSIVFFFFKHKSGSRWTERTWGITWTKVWGRPGGPQPPAASRQSLPAGGSRLQR